LHPNTTKARLKAGETVFGCFVRYPDASLIEVLGYQDWDFLVFDGEHGVIEPRDCEHMVRAAELRNVTPIVRATTNAPPVILRYMDTGAQGVHVPWVNSAAEAEAVVRSLAVAMHGGRQVIVPLLQLKEFDQYTTTHSLNVSVLSMALAEFIGLSATDVRTFGIAGLLHDIGKITIPIEVLTKPGRLTDEERALMNEHPAAGARMLLEVEEDLDLAVVVAYEHHIMINGGGYPVLHYARECHHASKLVHVCDVYDALRTRRPYREAWSVQKTLGYLEERSGLEFDPELSGAFVRMMKQWEGQVAVLTDPVAPVTGVGPAGAKTEQRRVSLDA